MKFAKGLNSPQRKLALNQILFGETFEELVEAVLMNVVNVVVVQEQIQVGYKCKDIGSQNGQGKKQKIVCNRCGKIGHIAKVYRAPQPVQALGLGHLGGGLGPHKF